MVGPPIRWFLLTVALSLVAELPLAGARRGALPVSSPPRRRGGGGAAHQAVHAAREAMAAAELKSPDRLQTENPGGPKSEKEPELEHEHHKYIIIGKLKHGGWFGLHLQSRYGPTATRRGVRAC